MPQKPRRSFPPWAVVLPLLAALGSGCGCFYGAASELTVEPAQACLDLEASASCAWLGLVGSNDCEDVLGLLPVDGAAPFEVLPGETFTLDDITPYAEMVTDDRDCVIDVVVHAELGDQALTLGFDVERVNRGLRLPCD